MAYRASNGVEFGAGVFGFRNRPCSSVRVPDRVWDACLAGDDPPIASVRELGIGPTGRLVDDQVGAALFGVIDGLAVQVVECAVAGQGRVGLFPVASARRCRLALPAARFGTDAVAQVLPCAGDPGAEVQV